MVLVLFLCLPLHTLKSLGSFWWPNHNVPLCPTGFACQLFNYTNHLWVSLFSALTLSILHILFSAGHSLGVLALTLISGDLWCAEKLQFLQCMHHAPSIYSPLGQSALWLHLMIQGFQMWSQGNFIVHGAMSCTGSRYDSGSCFGSIQEIAVLFWCTADNSHIWIFNLLHHVMHGSISLLRLWILVCFIA